jgi:hypothetical protein
LGEGVVGIVELAVVAQDDREVVQGLGIIRFESDGGLVGGDGFCEAVQLVEGISEIVMSLGKCGFEMQGLAACGDGFVVSVVQMVEQADVEMGLGVGGIDRQRFAAFGEGFVHFAAEIHCVPEIVVRGAQSGLRRMAWRYSFIASKVRPFLIRVLARL